MDQATDCPEQTKHEPQTTLPSVESAKSAVPYLFTTGDLADAMTRRGYTCTRDTVDHFIQTRKIQPVKRHGNYRMFDQVTLDLLRQYLKTRKRKRA